MAGYNLTLNTVFNPFTYQELLSQVQAATQAHQSLEDAYSEIQNKASIWENMASEEKDPTTYKIYKKYIDDLQAQVDQLATNGLSALSRRNMANLKSRYTREITPIETAYTRRKELAEEQRKASLSDQTIKFQKKAEDMSLDEFYGNPQASYGEFYSGKVLASQVAEAVSGFNKTLTKDNIGELQKIGLPYQWQRLIQKGASPEQILAAMGQATQHDSETVQFLRNVVENILQGSGIYNWAKGNTLNELKSWAYKGLSAALGEAELKTFTDEYNRQKALEQYRYSQSSNDIGGNMILNPLPLRSQEDLVKSNRTANNYSQYFYKDKNGAFQLNESGRKELFRSFIPSSNSLVGANVGSQKVQRSAFREFIESIGGKDFINDKTKAVNPGQIANLFVKYINDNQADSYDTYHTTRYNTKLSPAYGEAYMKAIKSAVASANGGDDAVQEVQFKNREYKSIGKIDINDLEGYTATDLDISKHGNTLLLQKTDGSGTPIKIKLPKGLNVTAESGINIALNAQNEYQQILTKGKRPMMDAKCRLIKDLSGNILYTNDNLSDYDKITLDKWQRDALDMMSLYTTQLVVPSKTSDNETKPVSI